MNLVTQYKNIWGCPKCMSLLSYNRNRIYECDVLRLLECMTCEMAHDNGEGQKFVDFVYRITHVAHGTCENPHESWVKEFLEAEQKIIKSSRKKAIA